MKKIIITLWILSCYQISFSQLIIEWEMDGSSTLNVSITGDIYTSDFEYDSELEDWYYRFSKYTTHATLIWTEKYYFSTPNLTNHILTAIDPEGNLYAVFNAKVLGDISDIAILKYSPDGDLIWDEFYSIEEEDVVPEDITVDSSGNIYITGTNGLKKIPDIVTMKYSTNGTLIWDKFYSSMGAGGWDCGFAIAVDNEGNVCVVGSATGFFTQDDYITIKYSPDGTKLWARNYNGDESSWLDDWPADITVDNFGNIYVTGYSEIREHSAHGIATIKYSPTGDELWVRRYDYGYDNNEEDQYGRAEIITDIQGNVYVTGYNYGGSETEYDMVTIKYSSDGTQLWANRYNEFGSGDDYAYALFLDNKSYLYVIVENEQDINDNIFGGDLIIIKYDSTGNLTWLDKYIDGGAGREIISDLNQNIYINCKKIIKYIHDPEIVSTPIFSPAPDCVKIYPNPANNMISLNGFTNKSAIINIYNLEGKLVLQQIKTINNDKIDITNLTQGIYLLQILENDKLSTQKLIIK